MEKREINYIKGDVTNPSGEGKKIIVHVCNDIGAWGKGFVLALSKRWINPEQEYRNWYKDGENFSLGEVQFVEVTSDIVVANMIGQRGIRSNKSVPPIRYEAINKCLEKVGDKAGEMQASVHMPRIGCGLAGGEWRFIEPLIKQNLIERNIHVFVYDFE
ncbi:macro domain-containing protein [uncultured Clostridium sp.]|uniref:macro domain-containing protein n=1 Tax=uncultured Clostridium sp. TaxID=59620 RepID=UPI0028EF2822|nr:macro domain-containing protein [uncultured Clostridium sp.]